MLEQPSLNVYGASRGYVLRDCEINVTSHIANQMSNFEMSNLDIQIAINFLKLQYLTDLFLKSDSESRCFLMFL